MKRNKIKILLVMVATLIILLLAFVCFNFFTSTENVIKNHSFEQGQDYWEFRMIGNSDLFLKDNSQSQPYKLNPEYLNKTINFKYSPLKFSGDFSKSILMFNFFGENNELLGRLTYVLSGSQDHGAYQNYIVDGVSYATKVISSNIKINEENDITLNILKDYNDLTRVYPLRPLKKEDIVRVEFSFASSCEGTDCLEAKYDESFLSIIDAERIESKQIIDINDESFKEKSPIYLTNYLPSEAGKYINICSRTGINSELSQKLQLEKNKHYLILVDTRLYTGTESPYFEIQKENGEKVISDSVNTNMSQTGWTTFGGIFKTDSEDYRLSLFLENAKNPLYYNCANFDNIRVYKISVFGRIFPFFLKKRLDVKLNSGTVKQSRLDYTHLYSEDFQSKLAKEYKDKVDIPIYDLYFNEDDFWNSDIRGDYSEAFFICNGNKYRVKIKIRGDGAVHWDTPTKSWRINFKEPNYFQGQRSINLIRPLGRSYLGEYFVYYTAKKLNLISLDNKFVFLRINDKPYGLMYEIEDWSDELLEKNQRPVGDLYGENNIESAARADLIGDDSLYKSNIERAVTSWRKYSNNPYNSKQDSTNIFLLTEAVNNNNDDYYHRLINESSILNWNVHAILSGSQHQDNIHNNRFYFNNTTGDFEFIPWDLRLNSRIGTVGKNKYNSFLDFLLTDKYYFDQRNKILFDYVNNQSNLDEDYDFYLDAYRKIEDELFLLDNYSGLGDYIEKNEAVEKIILDNDVRFHYTQIKNNFSAERSITIYFSSLPLSSNENIFKVEIASENPADFDLFNVKSIKLANQGLKIYKDDGDGIFNDADYPINPDKIDELVESKMHYETYVNIFPDVINKEVFTALINNVEESDKNILLSSYNLDEEKNLYFLKIGFVNVKDEHPINIFKKFGLIPDYHPLRYFIVPPPGLGLNEVASYLDFGIVNSSSQSPVSIVKIIGQSPYPNIKKESLKISFSNEEPRLDEKYQDYVDLSTFDFKFYSLDEFLDKYPIFVRSSDEKFSIFLKTGEYDIKETIIIPENLSLKIEPGVKMKFAENASLISYSRIEAIGGSNSKIIFTSEDKNDQWGVVAVLKAPAKSTFGNCLFENGGDAYINNVYFSGMLSVYHADAEIKSSEFRYANRQSGDDALNLKNGLFAVENNVFYKNNFDGLDFDFAAAGSYVRNNEFTKSGNDGLDISGSVGLEISGNQITDSGDKGISVGENSDLMVANNNLDGCNFGLAVKDSSAVHFTGNQVIDNNVGVAAYNKKEIFGGGYLEINDSEFSGNRQDFGLEVIPPDDLLRSYERDRYESKCYISDSKYKTSRRKTEEMIKEPKQKITSKKQLLKLKITDSMEDVGYKFAVLKDFCEAK